MENRGSIGALTLLMVVAAVEILSALFSAGWCGERGGIVFESEKVVVRVLSLALRVDGTYYLANRSSSATRQRILYPFLHDSRSAVPVVDSVTVDGKPHPFRQAEEGIYFTIAAEGESPATLRIVYAQEFAKRSGCYITLSTAAWQSPLQKAEFEVHLPTAFELTGISMAVDQIDHLNDGGIIYRIRRTDFLPDSDLCIDWRPTGSD